MKRKQTKLTAAAMLVPMMAAIICLIVVFLGSNQSLLASPMPQQFEGEYSRDGETWLPLTPQSDLSAQQGDFFLRGHFLRPIPEYGMLNYYCNHIGVEIRVDGEVRCADTRIQMHDMGRQPMRQICGREWREVSLSAITEQNEIFIRLYNPHAYGNRNAYREFLSTLCVADQQILGKILEPYGMPARLTGAGLMISALMILGASSAALIMRVKAGASWAARGLLTLFVGVFMFFDTIDIIFYNELLVFNTYIWQLSAMLAVLLAGICVQMSLSGKLRRAAAGAMFLSAVFAVALIMASFIGGVLMFDLLPVWALWQLILCLLMMGCCLLQLRHIRGMECLMPLSGLLFFGALLADLFGAGMSILSRGTCTKTVFLVLFAVHIVLAGKSIAEQYLASMRLDRMEKELENSRVAIMLSQIQPHFLYNSLSVIQELCHSEPLEAEYAIGRFAEFLRGNMTALTSEKLIPFADELHHVSSYLEIEKLRFGDQLQVRYEIEAEAFSLPTLTIQPLVENAVRHGVRKNENGGTVTISARECAACHEIVITDDGPGFSPEGLSTGDGRHVGIENVKKRLERMCGGSLSIDSRPGSGTRVTVSIPKEGRVC